MSHQAQGFVRNARFGDGPVIPGTSREVTRKWRALGVPEYRGGLIAPGQCSACGRACCVCAACRALLGDRCAACANVPGVKLA